MKPPIAPIKHSLQHLHDNQRSDDYAWLRDPNWQQVMRDPALLTADIKAYLDAENAYTAKLLAPTEALQQTLFDEFCKRLREDDCSVPAVDGDFAYYYRYRPGGEHPIVCRRATDTSTAVEQILLDGDQQAANSAYFSIGDYNHSVDHRRFAYTADYNGSESYVLSVRCLDSDVWLADRIVHCAPGFVWAADSLSLLYVALDQNHRPYRVMHHRLGSAAASDEEIYKEGDSGFFVSLGITQSRSYITINVHDHQCNEVWLMDAKQPTAALQRVAARQPQIEYSVEHREDQLWLLTNAAGAQDFKIATTSLATPQSDHESPDHWHDVVSHREGVFIVAFSVFAGWLLRLERVKALPRIVVRHLASGEEHCIDFAEDAYDIAFIHGHAFDTDWLRFSYVSMKTPRQIFDYNLRSRQRVLRKVEEPPSGHDPDDYCSARIHATAQDGASIPISLLYHRDTPLDGSAELLLYGYGAYGITLPASFSITRLSLVDRKVIYAIAHVRGGKERGYGWYSSGKLEKKNNTFDDFEACARTLISRNYSAAGQISIHGGSAGGMLVGAILNQCPELFHAAIAEVPFVDVLNTMCDDTLPLTPPEWGEWGNPILSAADYQRIAAYSPYDNVAARNYPHIIVTAGLTDPRVTYWEAAKWVAKLRRYMPPEKWLVLHTNMKAGHGGAAGRFKRLRETAMVYAFVLSAAAR